MPDRNTLVLATAILLLTSCAAPNSATGPAVVLGREDGEVRWMGAESADDVGSGGTFTFKLDRQTVPYTELMAVVQETGPHGIPVHRHLFESEILYVVRGTGFAVVGENRDEVPLSDGSLVYIPTHEWHGVKNTDPDGSMEILVVTTPVEENGLAEFFRRVTTKPGHPPLHLPEDEFLALFEEYGMETPAR